MYSRRYLNCWAEQQVANGSGARVQRHDQSLDGINISVGEQVKLDAGEAVKDLGLRIARTRERAAGNENGTSGGHRHRRRNFGNVKTKIEQVNAKDVT
uniref:Uncharacterized protein n=1 Tax=Setaria digitata TaxID=48799 RepID=A0A915PLZ2_9BILA